MALYNDDEMNTRRERREAMRRKREQERSRHRTGRNTT